MNEPAGPSPGWYRAQGDPPDTQRFWDGTQWEGDPQQIADKSRNGRLMILAGGIGMVVIAALAAGTDSSSQDLRNRGTIGSLALSLLLLGLAAWHFRAWGLGKLLAIGLVAAGGVLFTLVDAGDGDMLWEQGFTGVELVAKWLMVASAAVALVGVLWSFFELTRSAGRRSEDVAASVAWWQKRWMLVVAAAVALWVLGQIVSLTQDEDATPLETADEGEERVVQDEVWKITPDGDSPGSYIFHMVKTFSPLEQADVEDLGGRFVWPEAEIDLCEIEIQAVGDGFVQIGIVSPTTEGCPGMLQAFVDFGLPQTACLFVRSDGTDDEYCAPLTVG